MTNESEIEETETGLQPAGDGWWVLNAADIGWSTVPGGGTWCSFESPGHRSRLLGIGIHYLPPGETPGFYHEEDDQEGFLVLTGECLLVVEGEERTLGPWDYFHCPPGTNHITIGAGEQGCAILMAGTRVGERTHYPADPAAAKHGAAVAEATDDARRAYQDRPPIEPARAPWPLPG